MSDKRIEILERALNREKLARKEAEKILEDKAFELYTITERLKESNNTLESLLAKKNLELKGVFKNISDAYCVMDMYGNVLEMNKATFNLLDCSGTDKDINLMEYVYKEDISIVIKAFNALKITSRFKDLKVRIITKNQDIKHIHINASLIFNSNGKPIAVQGIARDITQEQKNQKDLTESESRLKTLIENLDYGVLLEDENRNIVLVNNQFCNLFSIPMSPIQMVGQDCSNSAEHSKLLFKNPEKFISDIKFLLKHKKQELGHELIMANGNILERDFIPIYYNNKYKGHLWTYKNVTEIKLAQQNLIESENRLKTLILNLDSGILLEDEYCNIVFTNNRFCNLFSIKDQPEQLKGQHCSVRMENSKLLFNKPDKFMSRMRTIVGQKKEVLAEELKMCDGKILERDYIPIYKNQEYKGHLWTYRDVTLKRNYDKNLEAERNKYGSIIANMHLGLAETDNDGNLVMANQSFWEITGYAEAELLGINVREVLPLKEDKSIVFKNFEEQKKGKAVSYETRIVNKQGKIRYCLVSTAPNYNINNKVIGSIGVILDITNLKNLEIQKERLLKQLEESNAGLQEYAHIVSHDLKSPLRSISALVSWIKEDNLGNLNQSSLENMDLIESTLEKMEQLITDILSYSSLSSGTIITHPIDLNEVVEEVQKLLIIPEHININILNKLPIIQGDTVRFQQLFQNLLGNAVKFIDKDLGHVTIDVKDLESEYQFSVSDNGIGIAKEYHKKIFEVFHSLKEGKESSGIGLSIVKKIVDLHQGKIWLESDLGKGATFYFTLKK
ncbi:PAS domain S-box-containing protein [Flavobacteriaceae bacterium MAR_2010_105]|nr:PAS domain S-box-containing protein [Flavobacteriaceae bacterium MAR_2010_105]